MTFDDYYDPNGNISGLEHLQELTWNYRDNISSAVLLKRVNGINDAEYYVYDSSGQRVRKIRETLTNSANNTIEVEGKIYLGGVEIKRISTVRGTSSTTILNRSTLHVMDDKKRIAVVHNWITDNNNREVNSSSDLNVNITRYQFGNHLDSASLELDPSGNIITYEEYFPYGDTSFVAGTNQKEVKLKEYRYTGKEKDDATGLYYFGARYYASWVGRWLSADPLFRENPALYEKPKPKDKDEIKKAEDVHLQKLYIQGLDQFCFVSGNPIKLNDPNGREEKSFWTHSSERKGLWAAGDWLHEWFGSGSSYIKKDSPKIQAEASSNGDFSPTTGVQKKIILNHPYQGYVQENGSLWNYPGLDKHGGLDFQGQLGDEIYSISGGIIVGINYDSSKVNVNSISIKTKDGSIESYSHVTYLDGLKLGQKVAVGQILGTLDNSGINHDPAWWAGAHLHFSVTSLNASSKKWESIDPLPYISSKYPQLKWGFMAGRPVENYVKFHHPFTYMNLNKISK